VPFGDVNCFPVPDGVSDEQALFLSDAVPTGYMGADFCDISPGDTVAVWGAGAVGLMAAASAKIMGAERVIVLDRFRDRLDLAEQKVGAETVDYTVADSVYETLRERTGGRGPDACIDAVGLEAHGHGFFATYDKVKQATRMSTDRPTALREAVLACRNGGTLSVPGVYGGFLDKVPFGAIVNKALTVKTGQTHVQRYLKPLLELIEQGRIDPSFVVSHHLPLEDAPDGYAMFRDKQDECTKIVLTPGMASTRRGQERQQRQSTDGEGTVH
jgi:threonine dehydrogenase-like Zn-dependent dehydrogenase